MVGQYIRRINSLQHTYEHTVAVKKGKADILSDHTGVEAAVSANPNLKEIGVSQMEAVLV